MTRFECDACKTHDPVPVWAPCILTFPGPGEPPDFCPYCHPETFTPAWRAVPDVPATGTVLDRAALLAALDADRLAKIHEMRDATADLHTLALEVGIISRIMDQIGAGRFDRTPEKEVTE